MATTRVARHPNPVGSKRRERPPLFDDRDLDTDHEWYKACRDHVTKQDVRRALTRIWDVLGGFIPEVPHQFVSEFRKDFPARSWELYTLALLARSGFTLERSPPNAPDFCGTLPNGARFWVECVVPGHGKGDDAVPQPPPRVANGRRSGALGPSTSILLRYTNAIMSKVAKVEDYRAKSIVEPDDAVLIAINQGAIDLSSLHDSEVPLMVRILFGIGESVIFVDPYAHTSRVDIPPMPSVKKKVGSEVSTKIFLDDSSAAIAGVLFARQAIFNLFPLQRRLVYLVHNPRRTSRSRSGRCRCAVRLGSKHGSSTLGSYRNTALCPVGDVILAEREDREGDGWKSRAGSRVATRNIMVRRVARRESLHFRHRR